MRRETWRIALLLLFRENDQNAIVISWNDQNAINNTYLRMKLNKLKWYIHAILKCYIIHMLWPLRNRVRTCPPCVPRSRASTANVCHFWTSLGRRVVFLVSLAGALSLEQREYWSTSQSLNYYYPSYRRYRRHLWEYSASILSGLVCRWHFGHFGNRDGILVISWNHDGILVIFP